MANKPAGDDPVEELLSLDREVLKLQEEVRSLRWTRMFALTAFWFTPVLFVSLLIGNIFGWRRIDFARINLAFIPICIVGLIAMRVFAEERWESNYLSKARLDLKIALERRRLHAASTRLPASTRLHIYRAETPTSVDQYRDGQRRYRRIHNLLQSVIIIGSLATSTAAGLGDSVPQGRWVVVATSFSVGIAAGFTGYFKFRERSFYMQQTADSIEEELTGIELKVGRYRDTADDLTAHIEFAERVESLKSEQRKRQQQLDQPAESPEG